MSYDPGARRGQKGLLRPRPGLNTGPEPTKQCKECGKDFTTGRNKSSYCFACQGRALLGTGLVRSMAALPRHDVEGEVRLTTVTITRADGTVEDVEQHYATIVYRDGSMDTVGPPLPGRDRDPDADPDEEDQLG
jgi:hypothetical protein